MAHRNLIGAASHSRDAEQTNRLPLLRLIAAVLVALLALAAASGLLA